MCAQAGELVSSWPFAACPAPGQTFSAEVAAVAADEKPSCAGAWEPAQGREPGQGCLEKMPLDGAGAVGTAGLVRISFLAAVFGGDSVSQNLGKPSLLPAVFESPTSLIPHLNLESETVVSVSSVFVVHPVDENT